VGRGSTVDAPVRPVTRLAPEQQRVAQWGALLAALAFVGLWAPRYPRGAALAASGIGVAMAGFLFAAARRGSLVLTAVAAFVVSFGPWGGLWLLGAPYIAWSGLWLYRASRAASAAAGPRPPRRPPRKPDIAEVHAGRRPPDRSKRYTPPAKKKRG
jgi:hypothetical protein